MKKIAIVLFNLGGPDTPAAVAPFLENLFSDPRILRVPNFIRPWLARFIAKRRAPIAAEIYAQLGGGSPILPNTVAQAQALTAALADCGMVKTFICMRYWHPRSDAVVRELLEFAPDELVLLPLYPQFSTTTSGSSTVDFWEAVQANPHARTQPWAVAARAKTLCCYPQQTGFINALAASTRSAYQRAATKGTPRILFSAHGLPEKIIQAGDPYQWQCEQTAAALVQALAIPALDWVNCYQSRVGPLKWIGPATEREIECAGHDKTPIVLVPIAFVSEHSETLVELDIEYRELAEKSGVPGYERVPTVSADGSFILGLATLVRTALDSQQALICPNNGQRLCPASWRDCPAKSAYSPSV
jgi:protoporphyrin/coproporphyrin ferrochelatase